jgi:heme exporter protein A
MMYNVPALDEKIEKLLDLVGLADFPNDQVQTFSRGMQQRLSLARAIIHDPMVLFLDEPYTGLDQLGAEDLKQILVEFRDKGKTIVMISHNLDRGLELCNRVAILKSGRVVYHEEISETKIDDFKPIYFKYTGKRPLPSQVAL